MRRAWRKARGGSSGIGLMRPLTIAEAAIGGIAAMLIGSVLAGSAVWARGTARAMARLAASRVARGDTSAPEHVFSRDQLAGLPAPVVRYFGFALTPGQPLVRAARVRWQGDFRMRPESPWTTFTAEQYFTVHAPGFVWDARLRMGSMIPLRVRDAYIAGEGSMLGKLATIVPVIDQCGTPEMAAGALSRWLGEAVWFPTALLPSQGLSWSPIDDRTARVTLTDGAIAVSADVRFGERGEITGMSMMRHRDVNGRGILTPFEADLGGDYVRVHGMMIPVAGEVAWVLPEGRFAYWRGRPATVEYEFAR